MSARAMWKAVIVADEIRVPVKLYAAVEDRNLRFHLLHDQDMIRIKQRMAHPVSGETVAYDQIRRGVNVDSDTIVMLTAEELQSLEPEASRAIEIETFVPPDAISPAWFDRPYFLGPDGDEEAYRALAQALAKSERQGVARWVLRGKCYLGALVEQDRYLMLITMRHKAEVIDVHDLIPPKGRELPSKERKLAVQLIEALEEDFDPTDFHDTYREQVARLIAAKARGETLEFETVARGGETDSLSESLAASLKAVHR